MTLAAKDPTDIRACMDLRRTNPLLRTFAFHCTSRTVELVGNPTPQISERNSPRDRRVRCCATLRRQLRHHMEPLLRLVRKDQLWRWGAAEAAAFAHVRDKLVENISLHKFVPELPLVVHCDASGSAEGAWLAQVLPSGDLQTIAFYSKSFSAAMRKQGATAREAHAVVFALHAARVYTLSSPHPTTVYTDRRSLTFVKDSTRSELSLRFLQKSKINASSFDTRRAPRIQSRTRIRGCHS